MTIVEKQLVYPVVASLCAVIGAACDVRTRRIPNVLTGPALLLGLVLHGVLDGWHGLWTALAAGLICGVIFLLWDEGGGSPASDDPPFIAISPNAVSGMRSQVDYDTSSYLKTVQNILGISELPCDAARTTVQSMTDLFAMPLTGAGA